MSHIASSSNRSSSLNSFDTCSTAWRLYHPIFWLSKKSTCVGCSGNDSKRLGRKVILSWSGLIFREYLTRKIKPTIIMTGLSVLVWIVWNDDQTHKMKANFTFHILDFLTVKWNNKMIWIFESMKTYFKCFIDYGSALYCWLLCCVDF